MSTTSLETNNLLAEDSFSDAIKEFQKFAGIPQTGQVDNRTMHFMRMPRCGNQDKPTTTGGIQQVPKSGALRISATRHANALVVQAIRRKKRYALQGSKWRRQVLTYRISQYPTRFSGKKHEVDSQIERAFGIWSQVAPIDFVVKREGRVHIDIRFASGDHGDGDAFDGPGNTLAHAYFPQYGGDAHFDDQEYWTVDSYAGTNIFQVAAHELGHSLGLGHSNVREALMAPFYQKYKPNFKLHIDDVLAIQALYGEKPPDATTTSTSTTTTTTTSTTTASPSLVNSPAASLPTILPPNRRSHHKPTFFGPRRTGSGGETNDYDENGIPQDPTSGFNPNHGNGFGVFGGSGHDHNGVDEPSLAGGHPGNPSSGGGVGVGSYPADLCIDPVIDAVTRTEDGSSYVFKGDFYWLLTSDGLATGYPRRISVDWDGLPGNLDAALTWADGKTFFFKGNKYWRFRNKRRDLGYPKLISAGFAGIPDDIDAAFVWSGNGRTYVFKGNEYWRFDSKAEPPVSAEYPRPIKVWNGVPAHINAAFKWENNVTYFFKGSQYYRFNDKEFKTESRGRPPFPRATPEWWFGCVGSNLAQRALPAGGHQAQHELANGGYPVIGSQHENSQDIADWSFLAGLGEESTKILGTHISDHKPATSNDGALPRDSNRLPSGSRANESRLPLLPRQAGHQYFGINLSSHPSAGSSSTSAIFTNQYHDYLSQLLSLMVISYLILRSSSH